jgi:hypothetical protein
MTYPYPKKVSPILPRSGGVRPLARANRLRAVPAALSPRAAYSASAAKKPGAASACGG